MTDHTPAAADTNGPLAPLPTTHPNYVGTYTDGPFVGLTPAEVASWTPDQRAGHLSALGLTADWTWDTTSDETTDLAEVIATQVDELDDLLLILDGHPAARRLARVSDRLRAIGHEAAALGQQ